MSETVDIHELAKQHLTPAQHHAYQLWEQGLGYDRIANMLGISKSSARDRIRRSLDNIGKNTPPAE